MPPKKPPKTKKDIRLYDVPPTGSQPELPAVVLAPPPPPETPKLHRTGQTKMQAPWVVALLTVTIPAIVGGIVSINKNHTESEAGFKATVQAVQELQGATKDLADQVASLQSDLDAVRDAQSHPKGILPLRKTVRVRRPVFTALPANLSAALVQVQVEKVEEAKEMEKLEVQKRTEALEEMMRKRKDAAADTVPVLEIP